MNPLLMLCRSVEAISEDLSIFKKAKNLLKESKKEENLTSSSSSSSSETLMKREDSYKLLWEELEKKDPLPTRESLCKTITGVAVLRARLVLATLMSNWPEDGPRICTTLLGCSDVVHYFCLLDLLQHQQTPEEREKVKKRRGEGARVFKYHVRVYCFGCGFIALGVVLLIGGVVLPLAAHDCVVSW